MAHNTGLSQDQSIVRNKQINHRQQLNDLNFTMSETSIFLNQVVLGVKNPSVDPYCYLGIGSGNPLQCSCWEYSMDRGAWGLQSRVTKSRTQPSGWVRGCILTEPHTFAVLTIDLNIFIWLCVNHSVMSGSLRPYGLQPARLLCPWGFSRQEYWRGLPCPPPGNLPDPGTEPMSPALRADSLPLEPRVSLAWLYGDSKYSNLSLSNFWTNRKVRKKGSANKRKLPLLLLK